MKKGFTLVELLAVVIILGILAVVIVPKIQQTLKDSKKNTYEASAHALDREADVFYANQKINLSNFNGCEYNFTTGNNTCEGFEFKGEKPESGSLKIASNGFATYALRFGDYCYMNIGQKEPIIAEYNEENCKIDSPNSFATDSWATISVAVKSDNISMYNLGDTKQVELEGFGTHTVRIANMSTPEECNTVGFSQTACGFVIEFTDQVTQHRMNPYDSNYSGTENSWKNSEGRQYINNEIYNSLPSPLKESIIDTYVVSNSYSEGITQTTDKLYLLCHDEYHKRENSPLKGLTRNLDYYYNITYEESINAIVPRDNIWSRMVSENQQFLWVLEWANLYGIHGHNYGAYNESQSQTTNEYGIAPAFRL